MAEKYFIETPFEAELKLGDGRAVRALGVFSWYTFAKVKLYSPSDQSKTIDLDLIIDTGSTYTWVKRTRLGSLGLKPTGRRMFKTIEGKLVEREIGEALMAKP